MNQSSRRSPHKPIDTSKVDSLLQEVKEEVKETSERSNREIIKHAVVSAFFSAAMDQYTMWGMTRKKPQVMKSIIQEVNIVMDMVDEVLDNDND